ncbi:AAA family ATPase [Streptomyces sp. ACA25]|uniref:ATP-binding protein n=1 Tax=Streptomyces sp. ACA25 TaxID=3022596 RepID=UPI0023071996|nr:AAA family ATPase [Streptomyces sp. ACA25]MDB1086369.1 AAA family ATPase [Streptomyces sp. ACA25]
MTSALIGREHPAALLHAEIDRALESHGGLVLVTGEAGIGKTTLVTGAVGAAKQRGALVLSGSCWDSENAPGYWPWVQVVRGLRRALGPPEWAALEATVGGGLSVLLGECENTGPADGFRIHDAVTTALVSVCETRPVVVLLEDLHWADSASLKLLEFATQHTWFERLLVIGTYRDAEAEADGHPLRPLLLPLLAKATTLTLTGLGPEETGTLMARTTGRRPDAALAARVHRLTGGNPFFVEQTARLWHVGSSVDTIAPGVRDALRRRLALLPPAVARLLADAAVLGREFDRQLLAATASKPVAQVAGLLGQALSARLVVAHGGGRFSFAHDLVREALYGGLDETAARKRHAAVVRAVSGAPGLGARIVPADLAGHAYLAGGELEPARTVELLRAAARDARNRMAFEEAIGHHRRAAEVASASDDRAQQIMIALDLGSELQHNSETDQAWRAFEEAVTLSRELGDPELLARVTLTLYQQDTSPARRELRTGLLREAHTALIPGRAGRAPQRPLSDDDLAQELTIRSAVLARRGADDDALAFSLWARHDAIWGLGSAAEREALMDELLAVARRTGERSMEYFAASMRWVVLLEQGDPRFLTQYQDFLGLTERTSMASVALSSAVDRTIISAFLGDFDAAEAHLAEVGALYHEPEHPHFAYLMEQLRWSLSLHRGRFDDPAELRRLLTAKGYPHPHLLEGIAALHCGDTESGLRHFAEASAEAADYPRAFEPLWLRLQAQGAAATRDPQLCARVREQLAPYSGQWMVSLYGCDIGGPVDLCLGLVEAALERWDAAVAAFTAAGRSAERLRSRPWSLEARARLAEALRARGGDGDRTASAALADEVAEEASALGMAHLTERVRRSRSGSPTAGPPAGPGPGPAPGQVFRREGAVWTLTFAGETVHLPDAKGLRDLHLLLGVPGQEVPAVRLLAPEGGEVVAAARGLGGDDLLDAEAKSQYKRRLTLLDEEIDRAALLGDDRRAAEFDREREALLAELRTAAGLAGRSRRLGDEAERARKTVTARIRDTLRKLDRQHPALAAHLRASVSTGSHCRYHPERALDWRL